MGAAAALPIGPAGWPLSAVEPAPGEAQEPLRHEDHHRDENDPDRDQVELGKKPGQALAQQEKKGGAEDRSDEGANAANHVEDDDLARDDEEHEIGRGEAVLDRVENAGEAREQPGQHYRHDLVALG